MRKSFTLIELMVTVGIVILIAAISGPALDSERNRANLNAAVTQIRDLISQTQTYALAPERSSADGYVLIIDNVAAGTKWGSSFNPGDYGIFSMEGSNRNLVKRGTIKQGTITITPTYDSTQGTGYQDENFFKIHFRTADGVAGCAGVYYDATGSASRVWNSSCKPSTNYAELTVTVNNNSKKVRINKITGETEIL